MKNMIIAGTGDSRNLKTSLPEGTTWEEALALMRSGTFPIDLNGLGFGVIQVGTQLDVSTLMPDTLATKIRTLTGMTISNEATPANQLSLIVDYLDGNTISYLNMTSLDLDNMDKTGYAFLTLGQAEETHYPDDIPSTGKALLVVVRKSQQISQLLVTGSAMWTRLRENTNDGFGPWVRWVTTNDLATTSANGLMSATDKAMMENSVVRGSKSAPTGTTNLDGFMTSGVYWLSSSIYTTGWPEAEGSGAKNAVLVVFYDGGGARIQELTMYNGLGENRKYTRMYINSQWYPWRTIVDVSPLHYLTASGKATYTINVPSSSAHLLVIDTTATGACASLHVATTSNGVVSIDQVYKGANLSHDNGATANKIVVTLDTTRPIFIQDICTRGGYCTVT